MKVEINSNIEIVNIVKHALAENGGYCPCQLEKTFDTKCMCKDFRENIVCGEFCMCGLYKKLSED